jgi:hypothetical protein
VPGYVPRSKCGVVAVLAWCQFRGASLKEKTRAAQPLPMPRLSSRDRQMVTMIGRFASNATFTHSHGRQLTYRRYSTNIAVFAVFYISALSLTHSAPQTGFLEPYHQFSLTFLVDTDKLDSGRN